LEGCLETDIRYYRRRACEEMTAADRAVTPAARERRLHLVARYLDHLKLLNAPSPFDERQFAGMDGSAGEDSHFRSAFRWRSPPTNADRT
jgi:hypothetical protein